MPHHEKSLAMTGNGACRETRALVLEEVLHRQALSMDQKGQEAGVAVCNVCGG